MCIDKQVDCVDAMLAKIKEHMPENCLSCPLVDYEECSKPNPSYVRFYCPFAGKAHNPIYRPTTTRNCGHCILEEI